MPLVYARKGYDYLGSSIETMETKADDCEDFKEKSIKDINMSEFSKEIKVNEAKGANNAPVMVTKTLITNEILYKAESWKRRSKKRGRGKINITKI